MQNRQMLMGAVVLVVIVIAGAWYFSRPGAALAPTSGTTATTTTATSSSTTPVSSKSSQTTTSGAQYAPVTLPVSSQDTVASWNFTGAYAGNATLTQNAQVDIARLSGLADESNPTVQENYISIGKDYVLLGDGKDAYNNFLKALNSSQRYEQEDAIAWGNLGDLMVKLGAYHTAETAYLNATKALPGEPSFYVALIQFLTAYMPNNSTDINAAFAAANKNVPGDASIAQLQAQYKSAHH